MVYELFFSFVESLLLKSQNIMRNRTRIYWLSQLIGWGLFVLGNILSASFQNEPVKALYAVSLCIIVVGILTTHIYRWFIHRLGWKKLNIPALIPRVFFSSILMSAVFTTINTALTDILVGEIPLVYSTRSVAFWQNILNFSVLFLLWNIIYFAVNTFENWKREEIKNLELRAAKTEIELNSFKAQMNPHFMFNALNSIRALVEENPEKAKNAVTMLSGILRSNLTLGKQQTIALSEELDLVEKYLSLEKIRFEERLQIVMEISPEILTKRIPPFMLQTIVENGLKHGIAKRINGGRIFIRAIETPGGLHITVVNSGTYSPAEGQEGIGLSNTAKRLDLLYNGQADFSINGVGDEVVVDLIIPHIIIQ